MPGLRSSLSRWAKVLLHPILSSGNVCMFHMGRTGSSVLADLLDRHPDVHWDGELYYPCLAGEDRRTGRLVTQEMDFRFDPIAEVRRAKRFAGWHWYGFEVKPYHLIWTSYDMPGYIQALRELGFGSFIVLQRRNRLRKLVSSAVAHARGQFVYETDDEPERVRVRLGVEEIGFGRLARNGLIEMLEVYDRNFGALERVLPNALHLSYEEHVEPDPRIAYRAVCEYLDIPAVPVPVRHRKATPYTLEEVLENYQEVREALTGTPYEWMLQEGTSPSGEPAASSSAKGASGSDA